MEVTLLGTGDTTGTPTIGCNCDTCQTARQRGIERSRFSVHIRNESTDESFIIDASPDIRYQFLAHDVPLPDAIVITHIHFDHLDGLGNAFRIFTDLPVYAASKIDSETGESITDTIRSKYYYLDAITVRDVTPATPVRICGLDVTLVPVDHPPLLSYGVVVEDPASGAQLSISGDTSYAVPNESRRLLANPDLFLANAIVPAEYCTRYPKRGSHEDSAGTPLTFGGKHMTREGALTLATELAADRTRLVHAAHFYPADQAFGDPLAIDGEQHTL